MRKSLDGNSVIYNRLPREMNNELTTITPFPQNVNVCLQPWRDEGIQPNLFKKQIVGMIANKEGGGPRYEG